MRISEAIAALRTIQDEHGDLVVMHHDDWNEFVVETVTFDPGGVDPVGVTQGEVAPWTQMPSVVIAGENSAHDGRGGFTKERDQ